MIKLLISAVIVTIGLGFALFDFKSHLTINYAGIIIILAGTIIWIAGRISLGNLFTLNLASPEKLVKKGIYRHIRHPIYLGLFLIFAGIIIALSGILLGSIMAAITLPTMMHDIITEERFLKKELKGYEEYCKETKRILPFVW